MYTSLSLSLYIYIYICVYIYIYVTVCVSGFDLFTLVAIYCSLVSIVVMFVCLSLFGPMCLFELV